MAPHIHHDGNPTVVAVDKDKHSSSAVRWAVEHLLVTNTTLILVHVKTKHMHNHRSAAGPAPEANDDSIDEIFTHFRAFCARKRIVMQVVILEGADVHSTLLDYINSHCITNVVLGASSRTLMTRKFWTHDVPTIINKAAPDFCTVYVISKGKTQSIRPAARQISASSTPPRVPSPLQSPDHPSLRGNPAKGHRLSGSSEMIKHENSNLSDNGSMDYYQSSLVSDGGYETSNKWSKNSSYDWTDVSSRDSRFSSSSSSMDTDLTESEISFGSTANVTKSNNSDNNNSVTRQVANNHMANSSSNSGKDGLEQAKMAEEAALALVEIERAKCRAAIEAAEKAQKLAVKETQRRKHAELKARRETIEKIQALDNLSKNDIRYRKYTFEEIEVATNKFSRSMKIGEGGYGPVFKGKLDHTRVAIKVLRADAAQGRKQFQQEVEVLSFMRHPNMVLLMGACPEYGCLVYEYMNNGSLEDRLYRKGNTPPIPWGLRFKIAADIATGLLFLHQAKPEPLVHRDLKPANILLDRHYTCKISDVGLARLVPPSVADSVTQYHMTSAAGTFCYIDPEYQQTGKLGTKSDIYSLGVMLLQIITARPPMGLTHQVEKAMEKGQFGDLLDPTVSDWPVDEAFGYAKLALQCAELRKKDRPDLAKVILPELSRLKELGMEYVLNHKNNSSLN
ncbi:hypothetical protein MIMGU_mgv1a002420mg [Erythranthe guttata]|uniref:RING-type E3 ubiquitin transferase n=1 Tax=Erythranthe guttata TaxID=4155 RepID=A0A022QN15_ERYGU|nr:hypothetical protein MIMGU_mgv1a002420mg [Erythranthe guttata]